MGLADNAARAAGEKIVVPPKPTPKATVVSSTPAPNSSSRAATVAAGANGGNRSSTSSTGSVSGARATSPSASSPTVTVANKGVVPGAKEASNLILGENIAGALRGESSWENVTPMDVATVAAMGITGGYGIGLKAAATAAKVAKPAATVATTVAKAAAPKAVVPTVAGPSLSVAQSGAAALSKPTFNAAAGLSNMAADVKNAANFVATNTIARNATVATGAGLAGAVAFEPVKNFVLGTNSSTAAPTQRPTTTGGTTPAPISIDAGKVSTPENAVSRPTSTGGSTAAPTNIGGSSLPADTVSKPAMTGTPASVVTGSSTGAGVTTGTATGSAAGTTTGSAAGAAAGAGSVNVPGSIPVPIGSTTTGVGSTTGSTTRADSTTRTESIARDEVLSNRPNRFFPRPRLRIPNLPDINGNPVAQGSVQSDWQDFRGTSSVTYKQTASSGPSTATFAASGKDKGEKNAAPAEDKGAKAENPTSTRPTATTGRRSGWQYSESAG